MLFDLRKTAAAVALAASISMFGAPASAQNFDGNHQARFGVFLQDSPVHGDVSVTNAAGTSNGSFSYTGLGIGVAGGLEWVRRGAWSWGFEVDGTALHGAADALDRKFTADWLATARVRGGLYVHRDTLVYGTIGAGFLGTKMKDSSIVITGLNANAAGNKVSEVQTGLAIGGGIEWDRGPWILTAEYLHTGFGELTNNLGTSSVVRDYNLHNFRIGLKFKVGHDYYYDDVAQRIGK